VGIGWNADMMCGNFDIDTTVRNQLNGITDGFQQLMGNVIQSATGAVASLPAMIIQRANPQLYDLLTNGVLQGRLDFDKSLLNCQKMAEKMTDLAADSAWFSGAKAENYQTLAASDNDAIRTDQKAAKEAAEKGKRWVGGEKRGGKGQPPIKVVHDATAAGWNILNQQPATSTTSLTTSECDGELCSTWTSPEEAAGWMTRVVGEQTISVAQVTDDPEARSGAQAGIGLHPLIDEEKAKILPFWRIWLMAARNPASTTWRKPPVDPCSLPAAWSRRYATIRMLPSSLNGWRENWRWPASPSRRCWPGARCSRACANRISPTSKRRRRAWAKPPPNWMKS
jgi:integrating conjugative element protein (TIGR03755 family)